MQECNGHRLQNMMMCLLLFSMRHILISSQVDVEQTVVAGLGTIRVKDSEDPEWVTASSKSKPLLVRALTRSVLRQMINPERRHGGIKPNADNRLRGASSLVLDSQRGNR